MYTLNDFFCLTYFYIPYRLYILINLLIFMHLESIFFVFILNVCVISFWIKLFHCFNSVNHEEEQLGSGLSALLPLIVISLALGRGFSLVLDYYKFCWVHVWWLYALYSGITSENNELGTGKGELHKSIEFLSWPNHRTRKPYRRDSDCI